MLESSISLGTIIALGTILISIFGLGTRIRGWVSEINDKRVSAMSDLRVYLENMLNRHEDKDQKRHEENLQRFTDLDVRLARMGNGSYAAGVREDERQFQEKRFKLQSGEDESS